MHATYIHLYMCTIHECGHLGGRQQTPCARTATHRNALQRAATQHIATHCNAVPYIYGIHNRRLSRRKTTNSLCMHCNVLLNAAQVCCCSVLQYVAVGCSGLQCMAHVSATILVQHVRLFLLQLTAAHCSTLQHTASHCITLQHTAAHCSTLQHTATHCNTLQHTATH